MSEIKLKPLPKECKEAPEIGHTCEKCSTEVDNTPNAIKLYEYLKG